MGNNNNCGCKCQNKPKEDELDLPMKQQTKDTIKTHNIFNKDKFDTTTVHISNSNETNTNIKAHYNTRKTPPRKDSIEDAIQMNLFEDNKITLNEFNNKDVEENKYKIKEQSVKIDTSVHNNVNYNSYEKELEDDYEPKPKAYDVVVKQHQLEYNSNNNNNNNKYCNKLPQLNLNEFTCEREDNNCLQIETLKQNLTPNTTHIHNIHYNNTFNTKSTPKQYNIPIYNINTDNDPIINNNNNVDSLSNQKHSKTNRASQTLLTSSKNGYLASEMVFTETSKDNINPTSHFQVYHQSTSPPLNQATSDLFTHHKIILKQSPTIPTSPNEFLNFIPDISLINNFLVDVLYYSELYKLNHNDNLSKPNNRKYISRFCVITKTSFKYFASREKFITLQKPILSIDLSQIKQVSLFQFENEIPTTKPTQSLTHHHKQFMINNNPNRKLKIFYNFILLYDDLFEIFASENQEISNKFVSIINYYINDLNNL